MEFVTIAPKIIKLKNSKNKRLQSSCNSTSINPKVENSSESAPPKAGGGAVL